MKKGEPQVNIRDICKTGASPLTVFKFMQEEAGYLYYENNCKRYVQKIFNKISECKKWNPVAPQMFTDIQRHLQFMKIACFLN